MKNKIVTILLSALIIISVGGNIYLLNQSKDVSVSLASATTELNNLSASITEKDNLITEANTTISELETTIADLQSQVTALTETVSALETENQELLEPSQEDVVEPEATPAPEVTQGEGPTKDSVRANLDKQLADGVITKEVYDECIAMLGNMTFDGQGGFDIKPSSEPQVITSDTALELKESTGSAGSFDFSVSHPSGAGVQVQ